jgi:hypothetical protein
MIQALRQFLASQKKTQTINIKRLELPTQNKVKNQRHAHDTSVKTAPTVNSHAPAKFGLGCKY